MIDLPRLIACGVTPSVARVFEAPLSIACVQFGIATPAQQAAFLAQAMHESRDLTKLEESLWYSRPEIITNAFKRLRTLSHAELLPLCKNPKGLALAAYSNINGNGGPETGDGWTYRGAGPFQLTGRRNFADCGTALGRPFERQPELLRVPGLDAALSAAWFWNSRGCNGLMTTGNFDETTRRINGGTNGQKERRALFSVCLEALT